jgi:hypothetical protein
MAAAIGVWAAMFGACNGCAAGMLLGPPGALVGCVAGAVIGSIGMGSGAGAFTYAVVTDQVEP